MTSAAWRPDILGPDFHSLELELAPEAGDGSPRSPVATLVRHAPSHVGPDGSASVGSAPPGRSAAASRPAASPGAGDAAPGRHAVLYIHGFTDYFFQRHVAEHFTRRGFAFYALDLRRCGRSLREGEVPHFVRDLAVYDEEITRALERIAHDTAEGPVLLAGHSTGGLILPLWLDRMRRGSVAAQRISGLVLNSPWFDLQGPALLRSAGTLAVDALGRVAPLAVVPTPESDVYGATLHVSRGGEWSYELDLKPLSGFPIRAGWLRAVRAGHARLHRGLDVGVPSLVLRSARTTFALRPSERTRSSDTVLDVDQIARWSGCLGGANATVPITGALHDVFLSAPAVRARAFDIVDQWIDAAAIRMKESAS